MSTEAPTIPSYSAFQALMRATDAFLNRDAGENPGRYAHRSGTTVEEDVLRALNICARGTGFEGHIQLVSGRSFPDIVLCKKYGVEVKSTLSDQWTSVGSSILESSRVPGVEHIWITFCKLGGKMAFLSRPYAACLSEIAVTHYPRYRIDMQLKQGETIFDKMDMPYEILRRMDNPVPAVSRYYRNQLKEGESLWWAQQEEEQAAPPILRLWTALSAKEKAQYTARSYAFFPEIANQHSTGKYQRCALWLATSCSIVNTNIRDQFSAGGRVDIVIGEEEYQRVPAVFGRLNDYRDMIRLYIFNATEAELKKHWQVESLQPDRLMRWTALVASQAATTPEEYARYSHMLHQMMEI